jgi:sodium pump decarboxylase gamma subunit
MKKLFNTLLMLTTVFALTACGSDDTISDVQQSKISAVESKASYIVEYTQALVVNNDVDALLDNYNNVELADLYAASYSSYAGDSSFTCEGKAVNNALTSFQSGLEDIGSITDVGTPTATVDDDTIIVTVPVTGETGTGSVEMIFTNDIYLTMSSCTLNVDESMGSLMARAGLNTLMGMGTVFVVLILISLIISLFSYIPKLQASFGKKNSEPEAPKPAPVVAAPVVEEEEELSGDEELVAVIAAAIAAYEGTASVEGFQVRSIKRAGANKWKRA